MPPVTMSREEMGAALSKRRVHAGRRSSMFAVRLASDELEGLDALAREWDCTRTDIVRECVRQLVGRGKSC